jgi:hypothetical protein
MLCHLGEVEHRADLGPAPARPAPSSVLGGCLLDAEQRDAGADVILDR